MVQYKKLDLPRDNQYWKVSPPRLRRGKDFKAALTRARYHFLQSTSKSRLIELCARAQRGLTSYEGCGKEALKMFCARRGLQISDPKLKKGELIQLLENADDDQTFVRFVDSPPELRVYIYELHFKSFGRLSHPAQPPITQVSRLLREESLPLFYKTCTFIVNVSKPHPPYEYSKLFLNSFTKAFLEHTSDENLNRIRRIELTGPVEDEENWWRDTGSWLLNFNPNAKWPVLRRRLRGGEFALSLTTNKKLEKKIAPIQRACIEGSQPARNLIPRFVEVFEGQDGAQ